ncbi:MAG: SAM-dependent methyltransferase [Chloroflexi bacterium]|nr:SAM-dependent methyltransferase [Chloroflexota bacterium]
MDGSPESEIRRRVAESGRITFAEFMRIALYHPTGGYYASASAFGAEGDYYTSPLVHPAFGASIAIVLFRMWKVLREPSPFWAIELGSGRGVLAQDAVGFAKELGPKFNKALQYVALERYSGGREATHDSGEGLHHVSTDALPIKGATGCIFSNELPDAFPVHRFQVKGDKILEIYVTRNANGVYVEELDVPSTPMIVDRLASLGIKPADGFRGEVNLEIGPWMASVSASLKRGFILTIDYGHLAEDLYAPSRSSGTLQTYYRHMDGASPYQRIGRQDITAHVDFSLLQDEGERVGLNPIGLTSQAEFLKGLGHHEFLRKVRTGDLSAAERAANMMSLNELVKPGGLGDFKVLVQEKGSGIDTLEALRLGDVDLSQVETPLLGDEHMPLMRGAYPHQSWEMDELWPFDEGSHLS